MLELVVINRLAREAALETFPAADLRVDSKAIADSNGDEALRVMLVLGGIEVSSITGDTALDTTVNVQHKLRDSGEERLAIIEFATEDELSVNDDDE